ncbi:hypothetical protein ACFQ6Q_00330 [Streptomyces sp. NPDC056437]|uniref:hypothetical protein n=1 Tax=Streptomyces sp. NPDC056437 TaxID=3345816 RepID=UPI0036C1701B
MNEHPTVALDGLTENVRLHIYSLFYDQMKLCGCGMPEEVFDLVRDLLAVIGGKGDKRWEELAALIPQGPALHMALSMLDAAGLTEHGRIITACWLTPKGIWYLRQLRKVDDWDDIEGVGLPHDGTPCTDRCFLPPLEGIRP